MSLLLLLATIIVILIGLIGTDHLKYVFFGINYNANSKLHKEHDERDLIRASIMSVIMVISAVTILLV